MELTLNWAVLAQTAGEVEPGAGTETGIAFGAAVAVTVLALIALFYVVMKLRPEASPAQGSSVEHHREPADEGEVYAHGPPPGAPHEPVRPPAPPPEGDLARRR